MIYHTEFMHIKCLFGTTAHEQFLHILEATERYTGMSTIIWLMRCFFCIAGDISQTRRSNV